MTRNSSRPSGLTAVPTLLHEDPLPNGLGSPVEPETPHDDDDASGSSWDALLGVSHQATDRATQVDDQAIERAKESVAVHSEPPSPTRDPDSDGPPLARPHNRIRASNYAGRYELIGLLGVGGMGSVYRVRDLVLDEEVALKILRKDLANNINAITRFRREVRLTRRITHPNVIRIYDVGEHRHEHYYTMECVVGEVMSAQLGAPFRLDQTVDVCIQLADGLAATHAAGVIHRDLKPDNILMGRDGRVVLTDFGVATMRDDSTTRSLPLRGAGTPLYMAPEQIEARPVDERTDLYALGLIMFELLTGKTPWSGNDDAVRVARLSVPAPSPQSINPSLPDELAQLVLQLLAREPVDRPAKASDVGQRLRAMSYTPKSSSVPVCNPVEHKRHSWPAIATTNTPHVRAVAVLPVRNDADPRDGYIAEAMTTALIDRLVLCPGVRVASRVALRMPKGQDLRDVGRRARADVVVEAALRKRTAGMMNVDVRVIEVEHGFVLWAESFQRTAADLFELQDEIAAAVARALTTEMSQKLQAQGPADRSHVDTFLQAKQAYGRWTPDSVERSVELFETICLQSPDDALVHAYLSLALLRKWWTCPRTSASIGTVAQQHARAALEANANCGEAHLALAMHANYNANWVVAARRLEEAVRCNPALSDAHAALGHLQATTGHPQQGIRSLLLALRIEPTSLMALVHSAYAFAMTGQPARAIEQLAKADEISELHPETVLARLRVSLWLGDRKQLALARSQVEQVKASLPSLHMNMLSLFHDTEPDVAIGALTAYAASEDTAPAARAQIMLLVAERMAMGGQIDEAWSALRAAAPHTVDALWFDKCPGISRLNRLPAFVALRSHVSARAAQVFDSDLP